MTFRRASCRRTPVTVSSCLARRRPICAALAMVLSPTPWQGACKGFGVHLEGNCSACKNSARKLLSLHRRSNCSACKGSASKLCVLQSKQFNPRISGSEPLSLQRFSQQIVQPAKAHPTYKPSTLRRLQTVQPTRAPLANCSACKGSANKLCSLNGSGPT